MRKVNYTIDEIRDAIVTLKGVPVKMRVNQGRKRIVFKTGVIENIYPSVFTVRLDNADVETVSYSYSDVLCGDVRFKRLCGI